MQKETVKGEGNMGVYESSFILAPSLAEEQVSSAVNLLEQKVKELDGEVLSSEAPALVDLAYPIIKIIQTSRQKYTSGYFGWTKFEVPVESLKDIEKFLKENKDIIRFLIIKTVKENTLLHGKMFLKKEEPSKVKFEAPVQEIPPEELSTPEEIDKSIDQLVIE